MADERMICLQQSNNWYHFVNWPGYPETSGLQCKCWYRLPPHGNIRNARVGELWLVDLIDGHNGETRKESTYGTGDDCIWGNRKKGFSRGLDRPGCCRYDGQHAR